uniref:TLC domain-containing protein n=2 Tax=Mesocestoides corti TaxID=53468 RepID=A0A5K3EZ89_MESCO
MDELTIEDVWALTFSLFFCLLVYCGGQLIKKFLLNAFQQPQADVTAREGETQGKSQLFHTALQDGIGSFQVCACSLENSIVREALGTRAVLVAIGIHGLLMQKLAWNDALGSPCNVFYRYMTKKTNLRGLCLSWVFQLVGAFASLYLSYAWWGLRLTTHHASLLNQKAIILEALQREGEGGPFSRGSGIALEELGDLHVPVIVGGLIEAGAAFVDVVLYTALTAYVAFRKSKSSAEPPEQWFFHETVAFSIRQATALYIIYLCLPLTGAYLNGVNAVVQTWGLGRARHPLVHLFVYWVSPLVGIWTGLHLVNSINLDLHLWNPLLRTPLASGAVLPVEADALTTPGGETPPSHESPSTSSPVPSGSLQPAAASESPSIVRSRSLLKQPPETVRWRRTSECLTLPQQNGDRLKGSSLQLSETESTDDALNCHRWLIENSPKDEGEEILRQPTRLMLT